MIITFWKGSFVADHRAGDEKLLKKAGFKLHEPTLCDQPSKCRGCRGNIGRRYFSTSIEHATRLKKYCNERALGVMKEHLAKLAKSRAIDSSIRVPAPPGLSYEPYQRAGIAYMIQRRDTLVADDMGLGKTIEALGFVNYVRAKKILIVCPASLPLNWKYEAEKWLIDNYQFIIPERGDETIPDSPANLIVIVNYEKTVGTTRGAQHVDTPLSLSLKAHKWDVGIFDEAHALKNPDSLRSKAVLSEEGIYEQCKRALFLTGTPMENRPLEIWPIAATLCPARFGDWWEFARRYCGLHRELRGDPPTQINMPDGTIKVIDKRRKVWVADGSANHSELQQRLRTSIMIRRLKGDVLKELPPKRRQLLVLSDADVDWDRFPDLLKWRAAYQAPFDDGMARLEAAKTKAEYQAAVKALNRVTVPFTETSVVRHQSALLKLPACLKLADDLLASGLQALVTFGHHTDVLKKIHEHYGDRSCVIYGDTPKEDRIPIVNLFQSGQKEVFIGGLKAAGSGITLTRADTLLFLESDWNPSIMSQAEDRLCRRGQKKMVQILHPVLDGTIDANMVKMTIAKQTVIDKILDEVPEEIRTMQAQALMT